MGDYYAAVDIGASGGRLIVGRLENGRLAQDEIYRFKNGAVEKNGHLVWDIDAIFGEILIGLKKCREVGKIPASVGVDTWGVDFALLDKNGQRIGDCVAYRDKRTEGIDLNLSSSELYLRTGIAKQSFNTIYQLAALKHTEPKSLQNAERLLLLPEYIGYLLTGNAVSEYTNCSTTALVNAATRNWDDKVIEMAGLPPNIFGKIEQPGKLVGKFTQKIKAEVGFDCSVIAVCSHDTASAVLASPIDEETLYISSGTWSLLGAELDKPVLTDESRLCGLTNEGGYGETYRYLKNIMGLWIVQNIKKEMNDKYSFAQLAELAQNAAHFTSRIDVNNERFLSPSNMTEEIKSYLKETNQKLPNDIGELLFCVYTSLAESYAESIEQIEKLTDKTYKKIAIVGGGCQNLFLNKLTAETSGKIVTTGPIEATAIGNIGAQMIASGEIVDKNELRRIAFL